MFDIQNIFGQFDVEGDFVKASELGSGHINDTFLVETASKNVYVLQRINPFVFADISNLIKNKIAVSNHLLSKFENLSTEELRRRVLVFAQTTTQENYHRDVDGNYWNLTFYIKDCVNYLKVPNKNIAFEAGKIFGEFLHLTQDFDLTVLTEILTDFHTMSFRLRQFDEALKNADAARIDRARDEIAVVENLRREMLTLENLVNKNKIPFRLTHSDTKISNALFSLEGEALCVIDTDTVMEGIIHYDFGDAVRTICNNGAEDEQDLSKVTFNLEYFEAFAKGFLRSLKGDLTDLEVSYLAFSAKAMTFMVGLRMLTDFLNNDVYFKPKYELHNLDRAKNQIKLVEEITNNFEKMNKIIQSEYRSNLAAKS